MTAVHTILELVDYFNCIGTIASFTETTNEANVACSTDIGFIRIFIQEDLFSETSKIDVRYVIEYGEHSFTTEQVHTLHINDGSTATLNAYIQKKALFNDRQDVMLYFKMSNFIAQVDTNEFYNFLNNNESCRYIFLPVASSYENPMTKILPLSTFSEDLAQLEISSETKNALGNIHYIREQLLRAQTRELPTPLSLYFQNKISERELRHKLDFVLIRNIITHIANDCDNESFSFRGYRNIELRIGREIAVRNVDIAYRLFTFVYDKEKFFDKAEITRNVITMYLEDGYSLQGFDTLLDKIYASVQQHFSAYVQDKIKKFFDQRKDVEKEAHSAAKQAKEQTDQIVSQINTSLLGVLTGALTVVFTWSKAGQYIFVVALLFHSFYFFFSWLTNTIHSKTKMQDVENTFDSYTSQFTVLDETQVQEIKNTYIKPTLDRLKRALGLYRGISWTLSVVMVVFAIFGWNQFHPVITHLSNEGKNNAHQTSSNSITPSNPSHIKSSGNPSHQNSTTGH